MPHSVSRRVLLQKLKRFGFAGPYSGGKHSFVVKGNLKIRVPNPHQGTISKGLLLRLLHQAGISPKEWENE